MKHAADWRPPHDSTFSISTELTAKLLEYPTWYTGQMRAWELASLADHKELLATEAVQVDNLPRHDMKEELIHRWAFEQRIDNPHFVPA